MTGRARPVNRDAASSGLARRCERTAMTRRRTCRIVALLVIASALGGCDKCADYFIANPFGTKPAGTCPSGAIPAAR